MTKFGLETYLSHGEWAMVSTSVTREDKTYTYYSEEAFPEIYFTVHLQVTSWFYVSSAFQGTVVRGLIPLNFDFHRTGPNGISFRSVSYLILTNLLLLKREIIFVLCLLFVFRESTHFTSCTSCCRASCCRLFSWWYFFCRLRVERRCLLECPSLSLSLSFSLSWRNKFQTHLTLCQSWVSSVLFSISTRKCSERLRFAQRIQDELHWRSHKMHLDVIVCARTILLFALQYTDDHIFLSNCSHLSYVLHDGNIAIHHGRYLGAQTPLPRLWQRTPSLAPIYHLWHGCHLSLPQIFVPLE